MWLGLLLYVPSPASTRSLGQSASDTLVLLVSWAGRVARYPIHLGERLVVGRQSECDVVIDDPSVSRRHCTIRAGTPLAVRDEGSHNGTFVLGMRIEPNTDVEIAVGTGVDVGTATFMILREHAPLRDRQGARQSFRPIDELVDVIAPTSLPIIIVGETGTGKEVLAERIHALSGRGDKPMVKINCAAIPEGLLESELFGHAKGAFTGAVGRRDGMFQAADKGTLFLDEIGEMPPAMQAKLLRVLESGEVIRVGSTEPQKVDVRVIAATHRDLGKMIASGAFRQDLFYRLNGFAIGLPPLRERPSEIPSIARTLLEKIGEKSTMRSRLSEAATTALQAHAWPGNVRQLRTVLERASVLAKDGVIEPDHLMLEDTVISASTAPPGPQKGLGEEQIRQALATTAGNQKAAAELLRVSRQTLIKYMERFGIGRPRKGS